MRENRKRKFIFIVQGEGRGHMSQAITLGQLIERKGHEVGHVIVGTSNQREIPAYFSDFFNNRVTHVRSPNFVRNADKKSVNLTKTFAYNIRTIGGVRNSLKKIHEVATNYQPDCLVSFYDMLGGLYFWFYKPHFEHIAIGHQYLHDHPQFIHPKGDWFDRGLIHQHNKVTSIKAYKKLALSFCQYSPMTFENTIVVPALIREDVLSKRPKKGNYILIYLLNEGYVNEIDEWHQRNPDQEIHCFWDKKDASEELCIRHGLTFHRLNDKKFARFMENCKAYASTAGFESICEAVYMDKPVMMVPVQGHYDQTCNAIDAENVNAGVSALSFDIDKLLKYLPVHKSKSEEFRAWIMEGDSIFTRELSL